MPKTYSEIDNMSLEIQHTGDLSRSEGKIEEHEGADEFS